MMEHAEHSPAAIREKAAGAVNCQSVTLPSGLTVLCRTMPGYSSVHAMYATNFGSVVREFTLNGKRIQLPAGTAHFLEHKMFESEQGDAFDLDCFAFGKSDPWTACDFRQPRETFDGTDDDWCACRNNSGIGAGTF